MKIYRANLRAKNPKEGNMKKGILIALALLLVFSASALAAKKLVEIDDGAPEVIYDNCISTNVWPWLGMFYNIGYERMIGSSFSLRVRGWYQGVSGDYGQFFSLGADAFFHPLGKGIAGWYIGPKYDAWIATGSGGTGTMHWLGAMGGYKLVMDGAGGFTLGIGLGAQTNIVNTISGSTSTLTLPGTLPCFDLDMAFAF
jgi:hypothetical protein